MSMNPETTLGMTPRLRPGFNYFCRAPSLPFMSARDSQYQTDGPFAQNDWRVLESLTLQAGLRTDYQRPHGLFVLPRFSALYKAGEHVSWRAGGSFGYKTPTIFSTTTEQQAHVRVRPLDVARLRAETSRGLNADVTVRGRLDELNISLNQAVFCARFDHSLIPDPAQPALGLTEFRNAASPVTARGLGTNLRLTLDALQFFTAYTFTDTRQTYDPGQPAAPTFRPLCAPLDGSVGSVALKITL